MKKLQIYLFAIGFTFSSWAQTTDDASTGTTIQSDTQPKSLTLNGYARGSVLGMSTRYDFTSTFAEISLQTEFNKNHAFLKSDIRVRQGYYFNEQKLDLDVKELYGGYRSNALDVLLGNQIVNWGRADGFNPTNNITPNDFFFLSADPDDQKLSNFMLRLKYRITPAIELDLIGIPFYAESNYRYDLFDMGANVNFTKGVLPDRKVENASFAGRLNFDYPAVGGSLSYFRGYDPYHGFDVKNVDWSTGVPIISNTAAYFRKSVVGGDFAIPIGNFILRGEAAYTFTDNPDNEMFIPKSDMAYVVGIETTLGGFSLIAQYIDKITPDFKAYTAPVLSDPLNPLAQIQYANEMIDYSNRSFNRKIFYQQEKFNHAVSLFVSKSFGYDLWNVELASYYNITSDELMLRPKISWKITDALTGSLGGNFMSGPAETLFGYSSGIMNGAFVELKVSF